MTYTVLLNREATNIAHTVVQPCHCFLAEVITMLYTKEESDMWSSDVILNELKDLRQLRTQLKIIQAAIQQLLEH
jgi:hypothetical protein